MMMQDIYRAGRTDISLAPKEDRSGAPSRSWSSCAERIGATGIVSGSNVAKVSLVGAGMRGDPGIAADMSTRSPRPA